MKRTLEKSTTWNETAQRYQFPQTPSRMQLSLWPAGQASNAEGTKEWAGGEIDWDSEDIKDKGYYYATIGDITVECYQPPAGSDIHGNKSYVFTDDKGVNSSIRTTNNDTVLASLGATGLDPDLGADKDHSSTSSGSGSNSSTVPASNEGSGSEAGSNQSKSKQSGQKTNSSDASSQTGRVLQSSLFAVLVAVVVLITM